VADAVGVSRVTARRYSRWSQDHSPTAAAS
jgi:response regulator of citrate/malate metabolism